METGGQRNTALCRRNQLKRAAVCADLLFLALPSEGPVSTKQWKIRLGSGLIVALALGACSHATLNHTPATRSVDLSQVQPNEIVGIATPSGAQAQNPSPPQTSSALAAPQTPPPNGDAPSADPADEEAEEESFAQLSPEVERAIAKLQVRQTQPTGKNVERSRLLARVLPNQDLDVAQPMLNEAIISGEAGSRYLWENTESGNKGEVVIGVRYGFGGFTCLPYTLIYTVYERDNSVNGTYCLEGDTWREQTP